MPFARLLLILAFLAVPAATIAGGGDHQARVWLERMMQAAEKISYEGTFVYIQGSDVEVMHIVYSKDNVGEIQRMLSLNGPEREVLAADDKVVCLLPQQQVAFSTSAASQSPFPISLPRDLAKLEMFYRFKMLGKERIANTQTQIIAIEPRDKLRFGYRLWLDEKSGMVLRSALYDEYDNIVEQLVFTELAIKSSDDVSLRAVQDSVRAKLADKAQMAAPGVAVAHSDWQVSEPPEGFMEVMHTRYPGVSSSHPTEHIVFTDGLATVSVFLEELDTKQAHFKGPTRMGAMNAFADMIDGYQIMVVGEVPLATVALIAASLKRASGAAAQ